MKFSKLIIVLIAIGLITFFLKYVNDYVKQDVNKKQKLSKLVTPNFIIDKNTAIPDSGFILSTGCIKANIAPKIEGYNIKDTINVIALLKKVKVYSHYSYKKRVGKHGGDHMFTAYKTKYTSGWIDSTTCIEEGFHCEVPIKEWYKQGVYLGSDYVYRDSLELDSQTIISNLSEILNPILSYSVLYHSNLDSVSLDFKHSNYIEESIDFNPPKIINKKAFKIYSWVWNSNIFRNTKSKEYKEYIKYKEEYKSYFKRNRVVEIGIITDTNRYVNDTIIELFERKKYLHRVFYGNDPFNPKDGDILIQVIAYKPNCIKNKTQIIGVANGNKMNPLDGNYYLNVDGQEYEKLFNELINKWNKK